MSLPTAYGDVAAALDALVAAGPLTVAFQPIVDLERGEPMGYEVLGRCGAIAGPLRAAAAAGPAALLSLAAQHGRILALDRRWRELAVERIAAHADDDLVFFLNVDPRVVDHPAFVPGFTMALVERHGLRPERFVLELTEAAVQEQEAVDRVLSHYERQGFRVALDDLGAGHQSLAMLLRHRPHIVKLDRELVRDIDSDAARAHLLDALAEFARRAGILLVAEGIETAGELAAVVAAGVPYGQGYLLGRPASDPEALSQRVRETLRAEARKAPLCRGVAKGARDPSLPLLHLVEGLRRGGSLEAMLKHVTDAAAGLLGVPRVSLRLLDEERSRLLVAARTGAPLHAHGGADFVVGEGLAGWVAKHGAPLRVDDAAADPRFVEKPGMVGGMGSFLGVPLLDERGAIGVLATSAPGPHAFSAVDERWLGVIAGAAAPHVEVARLKRLTVTDPLTAALNRRALDELFPHPAGADEPLSVAAVDVDAFKRINDRHGHAVGDDVLRAVVRAMARVLRRDDRIVRLGGEEFLLVLPGVGLAAAHVVAERVREAVATAAILPETPVTISIGVAERAPGEPRDALLRRADEALYRAKSLGKNRVFVAEALAADATRAPTEATPGVG